MRRGVPRRRGRGSGLRLLVPVVVLLCGVAGLGLVAVSMGWHESAEPEPWTPPPGTVAVPAAAVAIPAYTRVRLEHLVEPRTQDFRVMYLPEGSILPDTFVDAREIIGRVLASDKPAGHLFSERDFFPPGTREGIVAGIPPGKRALRIDAGKVNGIVGLGRGDRFDLVATLDLSRSGSSAVQMKGTGASELGTLGSRMRASTVVEEGAVVQPLETRAVAGRNGQVVEEMVIAVDPSEVAALTEALHSGARIDCVPLSGRPPDVAVAPSERPEAEKRDGLSVIETISGRERRVVAVPFGRGERDGATGDGS